MPEPRLQTTMLGDLDNLSGMEGSRYSEAVMCFPEGNYTGMVNQAGKPDGRGTMRFNDGSVYNGEWQNSVMIGKGTCTYADGHTKYEGEWKKGVPDGQGSFTYSNGDQYTGRWQKGLMDGEGVYKFKNSERYEGGWKQNKHHGNGKFTYKSGNVYNGQWRYGMRDGHGMFIYANGDEFAGEYYDDKKNGVGVYRRADGELEIKGYRNDIPDEGVRFSANRKRAWKVKCDGSCVVTSIKSAKNFRENTCMISPFLAQYLDKYS